MLGLLENKPGRKNVMVGIEIKVPIVSVWHPLWMVCSRIYKFKLPK